MIIAIFCIGCIVGVFATIMMSIFIEARKKAIQKEPNPYVRKALRELDSSLSKVNAAYNVILNCSFGAKYYQRNDMLEQLDSCYKNIQDTIKQIEERENEEKNDA